MSPPGISIRDLRVVFEPPDRPPVVALDQISQDIPRSSFVAIVGPSGCGKSTLLNVVAGLQRAGSGSVEVHGAVVSKPRRDVGVVFQDDSTLAWRSVMDNVRFAMQVAKVGRAEQRRRAQEAIDLVGLSGFESVFPAGLSGGMRQRVALARTLALRPEVLLMDEPFAALDQQTRLLLGAEVLQIWRQTRQTVCFVTHDISEALILSQQVWVMSFRPGRIIDVIDVDLPDDRDVSVVSTPEFNRLHARVWGSLEAEAKRGFAYDQLAPAS